MFLQELQHSTVHVHRFRPQPVPSAWPAVPWFLGGRLQCSAANEERRLRRARLNLRRRGYGGGKPRPTESSSSGFIGLVLLFLPSLVSALLPCCPGRP